MRFYIYRNFTVENLFRNLDALYSAYGDISFKSKNIDAYIWFYLPSINMNYEELNNEILDFESKFKLVYDQIPKNKQVIAFTCESIFFFNSENSQFNISKSVNNYNNFLFDLSYENDNLKIIEFSEFYKKIGRDILNWRFHYISQSLINPKYNKVFSNWFEKKLDALGKIRKKCLVLDLDNTLWGGILGEDGIDGIHLGNSYPGSAFYDFQKALIEAKKSGIILAVCSKNNESDVQECWENHPSLLIKQKHISSYRINWNSKPKNIIEISEELNIGLDSIVFIDDNPVERERVKFELPDVAVPDFPKEPYMIPEFFNELYKNYFQIYDLTDEDKKKTEQYKSNALRKKHSSNFNNLDQYLSSLKMKLTLSKCNKINIARISQMTQKTNQFNLTTKRYSEKEIDNLNNNINIINCLSVQDKFGDNGITAASIIIINKKNNSALIDSFLLSCRILGRKIENEYLIYILNILYDFGVRIVKSVFIETKKNKQTENFYDENGFKLISKKSGKKEYVFVLKNKLKTNKLFKLIES